MKSKTQWKSVCRCPRWSLHGHSLLSKHGWLAGRPCRCYVQLPYTQAHTHISPALHHGSWQQTCVSFTRAYDPSAKRPGSLALATSQTLAERLSSLDDGPSLLGYKTQRVFGITDIYISRRKRALNPLTALTAIFCARPEMASSSPMS